MIDTTFIILVEENKAKVGELYGMHILAFVSRHENKHRTNFLEWWGSYDNWHADQQLPEEQRRDRDGDKIPNDIEEELGLNPDNIHSHGPPPKYLEDFEWINYKHHKEWMETILKQENSDLYIKTDWAYPGKQTDPEF